MFDQIFKEKLDKIIHKYSNNTEDNTEIDLSLLDMGCYNEIHFSGELHKKEVKKRNREKKRRLRGSFSFFSSRDNLNECESFNFDIFLNEFDSIYDQEICNAEYFDICCEMCIF